MKKRVSIQLDEVDLSLLASAARKYAISVPAFMKLAAFRLARTEVGKRQEPPAPQSAMPVRAAEDFWDPTWGPKPDA